MDKTETFDIERSCKRFLPDWDKVEYMRSSSVELQFLNPSHNASSLTFFSNQLYYEIFTTDFLCPLRFPLPKTELDFLQDLQRSNIQFTTLTKGDQE